LDPGYLHLGIQGESGKGPITKKIRTSRSQKKLGSWKTPQVKGNYEPIIVAQKKPNGNLVTSFLENGVGLFNFSEKLEGGYFPSNVLVTQNLTFMPPIFLVPKPTKAEKGIYNIHPTVKPVNLLRYLIRLTTQENALVLDPFLGSGSTAIAAHLEKRNYLGFEINQEYFEIAKQRIYEATKNSSIFFSLSSNSSIFFSFSFKASTKSATTAL
jgi:site-specific DNA-methyltransferase (adenine-specific)